MSERDEATRRVGDLAAAYERLATVMYTVDTHAAWNRMGAAAGHTAEVAATLRPDVDELWAYFGVLGERLERARALLAVRRLGGGVPEELTALLTRPAVGLDKAGLPVDADTTPTTTVTLADLAERAERRSAVVLNQLSDVDTSASALAERYVEAAADVDAAASLAGQLGEPGVAQRLRDLVAEIERLDLADPLTAAPRGELSAATRGRLERLTAAVAQARKELDDVADVRDSYPRRRSALVAVVDQVEAAEAAVVRAVARAVEKIAEPGLATPPAAAAVLRARLVDLDALRERAETGPTQWRRLTADMSTMETSARTALARAHEQAGLADGLLARRNELRGRLEAYRAKAVASGRAEDVRLAGLFTQAHDLLYTAPCDLRGATRAVYAYQSGLAEPPGRRERNAVDE